VHDVGDYRDPLASAPAGGERPWRALQPGMVVTVEPGLYLRPAPNVPAQFENIGVRIEDDVQVTEGAADVLSATAPKAIDEIEALMREALVRDSSMRAAR
jgi:Xaa-Pro aminopeptidase